MSAPTTPGDLIAHAIRGAVKAPPLLELSLDLGPALTTTDPAGTLTGMRRRGREQLLQLAARSIEHECTSEIATLLTPQVETLRIVAMTPTDFHRLLSRVFSAGMTFQAQRASTPTGAPA